MIKNVLHGLRYFLRFCKVFGIYNKALMAFIIIGGVIVSFFELVGLSALMPLMNLILQPDYINSSGFVQEVKRVTGAETVGQVAMVIGFITAGTFILKNFTQIIFMHYEYSILGKWRIRITGRLYDEYMNSDYEKLMKYNSSRMIAMITSSIPGILSGYVHRVLTLLNLLLTAIAILGYVIFINWYIAVSIFMLGLVLTRGYSRFFRKITQRLGQETMQYNIHQHKLLQQSFVGYKETRTHLKEKFFSEKFQYNAKKLATADERMFFFQNLPAAVVELTIMLLVVIVFESIILTGNNMASASAQIGVIVLASVRMIPVINRIIGSIVSINGSQHVVQSMLDEAETFGFESTLTKASHELRSMDEHDIEPIAFREILEMKDIHYSYPEARKETLKGVSLDMRPGEFIGITGPSGSGKSTLVNILLGFLTSFQGQFMVDGQAITEDTIKNLRKIVGFVDQQIFIMDSTVAENVAYGNPPENIDRAKVEQALKRAQLWDAIDIMPDGMDTVIGESGKLLSGGQRQRLAIARAFYRDIKILILDEASAALDVETEHKFFTFLDSLKGELSVIMIAHRLSTLKSCDRVFFFEEGRIADSGNFEELFSSNDTFRNYIKYSQIHISEDAKLGSAVQEID